MNILPNYKFRFNVVTSIATIAFALFLQTPAAHACELHQGGHPKEKIENSSPICHFQLQPENICTQMTFAAEPNTKTDSAFLLTMTPIEKSLAMSEVLEIKAELWMDMGHGHGHGSAPVKIEKVDDHSYRVTNVWFVMKGPWQIRLKVRTPAGEAQAIYALNITQ